MSTTVAEDADCDGVVTADDCDDSDAASTVVANDADCDGVVNIDDCDDSDPTSTVVANDADCDGVVNIDDCDDSDPTSTVVANDADCDGVVNIDDCDDSDPTSTVVANDADCDGVVNIDDCDDSDPTSTVVANDADCDGVVNIDDCDDSDPTSTTVAEDADCDGVVNADDCDVMDPDSTVVAEDADCDGVLTADDCDDSDPTSTVVADDSDCDGVVTADDCDDSDPSTINDMDCDGIVTSDDCDDGDASSTAVVDDADCDGVVTAYDCDDSDPFSTILVTDKDCDGIVTADDCNDSDALIGAVADDMDCDGTLTGDDCDDSDASLNENDIDLDGYSTCDGDCDDTDADLDAGDMDLDSYSSCDGDCDDDDSSAYPGVAVEQLLGKDLNCDGLGGGDLVLADYSFAGEAYGNQAGMDVSDAGDVDGDGLDDILVAASYYGDTNNGKVYLFLASSLTGSTELDLALADYTFVGQSSYGYFGTSIAGAGDVDGDGLSDILIGAKYDGVYLILGSSLGATSEFDLDLADYRFVQENSNDFAGESVSFAGDVDGDLLDDILIGAPGNDDNANAAGKSYLILASSLGATSQIDLSLADYIFIGENESDLLGRGGVSSAGDVDNDGLDDILLGAIGPDAGGSDAGKAYLILGSSLGAISEINVWEADYTFVGENAGDEAGVSVSSAGDVDGDGLDDILIGADENDYGGATAGMAYLILGSSLGANSEIDLSQADYNFWGHYGVDWAGHSVSSAGDVDGDGLDDILIGAVGNDVGGSYAGMTYLFLGSSLGATSGMSLTLADYAFAGKAGEGSGKSVSNAGDVNGDGVDDIIIGAWSNDDVDTNVGKAYLILSDF
jgi:hypothetical protein